MFDNYSRGLGPEATVGQLVVFNNYHGSDFDRNQATDGGFKPNHVYEIITIDVFSGHTLFTFEDIEGEFNSVMFSESNVYQRLAYLEKKLIKRGVVDVKFHFSDDPVTMTERMEDMEAVITALLNGNTKPFMGLGDSVQSAEITSYEQGAIMAKQWAASGGDLNANVPMNDDDDYCNGFKDALAEERKRIANLRKI